MDEAAYITEIDQLRSKRYNHILLFAKTVLVSDLRNGTFSIGADSSCDIQVKGGSPLFPKLIGSVFVDLPRIRFDLAEGLGIGENDLDVVGKPMNIKISSDIQIMVSPPRPEVLLAINDANSKLSTDIAAVLLDKKSKWFPVTPQWILSGTVDGKSMLVEFILDGSSVSLLAEKDDDESISIQFKDLTNGSETYGGGRVMKCKVAGSFEACAEGKLPVALDFNRACHLPCAIAVGVVCPSTPAENHLNVRVEAGEMLPL
ncbi:hypothetical protein HDV05_005784 [Chytridiales sp. JEL 0842]|nr:hypothetical protein HDV05_005784 [Chytridiales sp. JEL 0842]